MSSDKCHVIHEPRGGITQRVAHHAAGGAEDNQLNRHDDEHGEQRLQEQFGNVGDDFLKTAINKVHEHNAQYDWHHRARVVIRRDGDAKKVETLSTANRRANHDCAQQCAHDRLHLHDGGELIAEVNGQEAK